MKSKELENKIGKALDLLSQANKAMIDCIYSAVEESANKSILYEESIDCYTELRTIKHNENGELVMLDDYDNEIGVIDDLTANELYDICLNFK